MKENNDSICALLTDLLSREAHVQNVGGGGPYVKNASLYLRVYGDICAILLNIAIQSLV